jgi:hypothetical protein
MDKRPLRLMRGHRNFDSTKAILIPFDKMLRLKTPIAMVIFFEFLFLYNCFFNLVKEVLKKRSGIGIILLMEMLYFRKMFSKTRIIKYLKLKQLLLRKENGLKFGIVGDISVSPVQGGDSLKSH